MPAVFRSVLPVLIGMLLCAATQPPVETAHDDRPTVSDRHDLRCAAAFAVVAAEQASGNPAALKLPPLRIRGKRYFGLISERIAAQTRMSDAALHDLLAQTATRVAHDGAPGVAASCLADLDHLVPPRAVPDAVTCVAILGVYADVLAARDADSALAITLRRESLALAPAAHAQIVARGLDPAGEAAANVAEHARVREALTGGPASVDADDFAQCRHLAAAKPS